MRFLSFNNLTDMVTVQITYFAICTVTIELTPMLHYNPFTGTLSTRESVRKLVRSAATCPLTFSFAPYTHSPSVRKSNSL